MKTNLFTALVLLISTIGGSATVIVSSNADAPSDNVLIANPRLPGAVDGSTVPAAYYTGLPRDPNPWYQSIGQAFVTGEEASGMTAITWQMKSFNTGILEKGIRIDIYKTASNGTVPTEDDLLISHSGFLPDSLSTDTPYLTFSFDEVVPLQVNSTYVIMFAFDQPTSSNTSLQRLNFETVGYGSLAPDNSIVQRWSYQGFEDTSLNKWITTGNGTGFGDRNQPVFFIHGAVVPEPTTASFGLVGVALLMSYRRWNLRK